MGPTEAKPASKPASQPTSHAAQPSPDIAPSSLSSLPCALLTCDGIEKRVCERFMLNVCEVLPFEFCCGLLTGSDWFLCLNAADPQIVSGRKP